MATNRQLGEFDIIEQIFRPLSGQDGLQLSDDVALLSRYDIVTKDLLIAGTHFLPDDPPDMIARKALRTNISDIICKGARPAGYLLGLALPRSCDADWLQQFADGLAQDQQAFGVGLLGGDTTRHAGDGPLVISITLFGKMEQGQEPVLRTGAQPGDLLAVTGTIGDAGLGLAVAQGQLSVAPDADELLIQCYRVPVLRPEFAPMVASHASAALDISDGLIADAGHIASASSLSLYIDLDKVPLSPMAQTWLSTQPDKGSALATLASFGDDYQILFTASPERIPALKSLAEEKGVPFAVIGQCREGEGVSVLCNGKEITPPKRGHDHFVED
ncbi:thiamine-phosphate kinase [Parvularcula flava]|uniref:Thiamine-monophosphate kinase n=1 Tax=Aquisalinus luteolus TaxID=1566827 RepID=A0A8J3A3C9_9PROT|nr:thiamine-phosphate kinase [Aquisalinus luteolus]NHK27585.1 thiamine-phosphate kinase [Aquisalinus luteolus]GGH95878.1 thiamine-monophosphate kinase [Aquisalinus luteolus]